MASSRLRRVWAWLWSRTPVPPPRPNAKCPICQRPIVVKPVGRPGGSWLGAMLAPRPREELVAACPVHGHPPFNADSVRAARSGAPDDG
jgi:hypothetical protein